MTESSTLIRSSRYSAIRRGRRSSDGPARTASRAGRWSATGDRNWHRRRRDPGSTSAWTVAGRAMMIAFTVGHPQPADLHRMRTGSGRSPPISRSTTSIGTAQSEASAAIVSSNCPFLAKSTQRRFVELALPAQRLDRALGGRVVARRGSAARRPRARPSPARAGSRIASRAWPTRTGAAAPLPWP